MTTSIVTPFSKYNKGGIRFYVIVFILISVAVGIYVYIYRNPVYSMFTDTQSPIFAPAELLALPHIPTSIDSKSHTELETLCHGIDTDKPMSDIEFLETMIPHHQVAVAVAKSINSTNQIIREFCRQIIWQQEYEITQMEAMIGRLPQPFSTARAKLRFTQSLYDFYNPPSLAMVNQPVCDPMHFQVAGHLPPNMPPMSDEAFLKHMATHHATAVKMAKTQMRTTDNSFIAALCYDLIHQQELELVKMNEMIANRAWDTSVMLG
jgi:uncharacterized protein (DUF305 family)